MHKTSWARMLALVGSLALVWLMLDLGKSQADDTGGGTQAVVTSSVTTVDPEPPQGVAGPGDAFQRITYTVKNNSQTPFEDFHIEPPEGQEFEPVSEMGTSRTNWTRSPSSSGFTWIAGSTGSPIGHGQTATFTLDLPLGATATDWEPVWVVTNNNAQKHQPKDIVDTGPSTNDPDSGNDDDTGVHGPPLKGVAMIPEGESSDLPRGIQTNISLLGPPGYDFTLLDSEEPLPVTRTPSGWNLTFTGVTGTFDVNGEATAQVTIPNDPALSGKTFYLVLKAGPPGGVKALYTAPFAFTIVD